MDESLRVAVDAMQEGRLEDALDLAQGWTEEHPGEAVGPWIQGRVLLQLNRPAEARGQVEEAARLAPSSGDVQATRGAVLDALGQVQDAYEAFIHALELSPEVPEVLVSVGTFLLAQGELQTAEECLTLAANHGAVDALAGLVAVRERQDKMQEAVETLANLPEELEVTPSMAMVSARVMLRTGKPAEACALMETLSQSELSPRMAVPALHLWGEALEQLGEVERAFMAHSRANENSGIRYNGLAWQKRIERIREAYTRERFEDGPRASGNTDLPILIVGMPRSGTSLVEQILASHPDVHGAGEMDELLRLEPLAAGASSEELDAAASIYLRRLAQDAGDVRHVTDKMPHNFLALGAAALIVPGARVVHVHRDPLDAGLSCFFRDFSASHDYATDLESIGNAWKGYQGLMQHWRECLPLAMHEISYEELTAAPERETRRLLEFCGLDWDDSVMRFHENPRVVKSASYAQVREPMHTGRVGRAERFGAWIGPLRDALAAE